ncbi:P-loop containing nucleoside triphosphate hydrolase [Phytophthora cactorum]|nr:P-loop containing nucleoside triphosphate hydrolase [Phytophthora cactorum]
MLSRKGSDSTSRAASPGGPRSSKSGRLARRRGSSAEAALHAETARLGVSNTVLKRGFLVKKGHMMPTRKERYFVLGQHSLSYYKPTKDGDVDLKGVLEIKASDVISPLPHSDVWLRIRQSEGPAGKNYKLDLKASNLQERREWIEALRKACRSELLLRQRTIQSDVSLLQLRSSRRGQNAKAMAELLSSPMAPDNAGTPRVDLRASFQIFHEMILGSSFAVVYDTVPRACSGISLAQEKSGSSELEPDSILAEAFKLRYQFEEIPENQRKLSRDEDPLGVSRTSTAENLQQAELDSPVASSEYMRTKQPWSLDRANNDDLAMEHKSDTAVGANSEEDVVEALSSRFDDDRIYTYINHHTMIVMNPYRLLQTARFTSIYDEQVVLTYADTADAETVLAPHPFAIAKQSLVRLFFDNGRAVGDSPLASTASSKRTTTKGQSLFLCGESGSGKTELAKDLLKYLVLVAQPALSRDSEEMRIVSGSTRQPKIKLFTSSTKSTIQMRTEEARTIALLEAKGVEKYEIVLLDLYPDRWDEMTSVSQSKRLPQVHVDGIFFGFYDKLEHLEDEEQLRMYFKNPHAAKKLSTVLDSNIILEAFGHATTSMNLNSSRFGKVTTLQVAFGLHPWEFQICGCRISPFLLEKSRVTSERGRAAGDQSDLNFHVLYAMVAGVNAFPFMRLLAKELHLDGIDCSAFTYLGRSDHKLAEFMSKEDTWKKDVERWQQVIDRLDELNVSPDQQKAIFKVLSAVLWLGNIELDYHAASGKLVMSSTGVPNAPKRVVELLELGSVEKLERMLMTKSVSLQSTSETFQVTLEKGQVNHVRDTLARLLYQLAFEYVVAAMNEATKLSDMSADGNEHQVDSDTTLAQEIALLKIVDVFGFEDLAHNSLDQLCINYMSEKLYAREEQHPLGVFSSLEELTILHQSENVNAQQEEKRNKLFGKRQSTAMLNMLPFVIPHARGNVIYDANDFVKKNSDFVYANLLVGLKASKRERRGLSNELLAWYGPERTNTVKKLLTKYNGREDELRSKLMLKKKSKLQEEKTALQLASDLQSLLNAILHDDTMRELLQQNEKIVLALRDMSLNPDILESQLADHELRGFYQMLIDFLQSKKKDFGDRVSAPSRMIDELPQLSLDERVLAAASEENGALWMRLVEKDEWAAYHDALVEVGDDPEMLLFHSEEEGFVSTLESFLKALELEKQCEEEQNAVAAITDLVLPSTVDEEDDEDAEMLELLLSVQFGPSLMAAMNQDAYFVQALQDPILMTSMQQLMANPKDFAISATLQQPAVREFFLKLIALSCTSND